MIKILSHKRVKRHSLVKFASLLVSLIAMTYIFIVAKPILAPLAFALLISAVVFGIYTKFNQWLKNRWLASGLTVISTIAPILIIMGVVAYQLVEVYSESGQLYETIRFKVLNLVEQLNYQLPYELSLTRSELSEMMQKADSGLMKFVEAGLSNSLEALIGIGLTIVYIFFILIYSKNFKLFLINQFPNKTREEGVLILNDMQQMVKNYLQGLSLVVIILCVVNSIGLSLFGVKYAILWGCLSGLLAIIPYVGTILGAALPVLFALATIPNPWIPIAIIGFFTVVQQLEGNFITPKIIGDKIQVNPFIAIFSVVVFGYIWGVVGAIIALPLVGLIKIILSYYKGTQHYCSFMSNASSYNIKIKRKLKTSDRGYINIVNQ